MILLATAIRTFVKVENDPGAMYYEYLRAREDLLALILRFSGPLLGAIDLAAQLTAPEPPDTIEQEAA